jgi:hypothetical protein
MDNDCLMLLIMDGRGKLVKTIKGSPIDSLFDGLIRSSALTQSPT